MAHSSDSREKQVLDRILAQADVRTDGERPWDINVRNTEFYSLVLGGGSIALVNVTINNQYITGKAFGLQGTNSNGGVI